MPAYPGAHPLLIASMCIGVETAAWDKRATLPPPTDHLHQRFLQLAVEEAIRGAKAGLGGPFGAVVVKDGQVVAAASNAVVANNDPSAHVPTCGRVALSQPVEPPFDNGPKDEDHRLAAPRIA